MPSNKIFLAPSKISKAGRGVFASRNIKKGELIETCPVIRVPKNDVSNLKKSILVNYYFYFGKNQKDKSNLAVALGYGSLYNHSFEPNATYVKKPKNNIIDFIAMKDIKKGEEITANYNFGTPDDLTPIWDKSISEPKLNYLGRN